MADHRHENHDAATSVPDWALAPFKQCLPRLRDETKFMHLAWIGLEKIRVIPELMKFLSKTDPAKVDESTVTDDAINRAEADAKWVDAEAKLDFPLLHSHCSVSLWGILEAFVEDLAVAWFVNRKDAWDIATLDKVRVPVGMFARLENEERARHVVGEIYRHLGADLKTGVGGLSAVLALLKLDPQLGDNTKKALHELCQVRNAIVHRGGRADQRLLDACRYLPWKVGESIRISHGLFGWYHSAAERYAERVMNEVLVAFGSAGCKCPGLDEISPRPAG